MSLQCQTESTKCATEQTSVVQRVAVAWMEAAVIAERLDVVSAETLFDTAGVEWMEPLCPNLLASTLWRSNDNSMNKKVILQRFVEVVEEVVSEFRHISLYVATDVVERFTFGSFVGRYGLKNALSLVAEAHAAARLGTTFAMDPWYNNLNEKVQALEYNRYQYDVAAKKNDTLNWAERVLHFVNSQGHDISWSKLKRSVMSDSREDAQKRYVLMYTTLRCELEPDGEKQGVNIVTAARKAMAKGWVPKFSNKLVIDSEFEREDIVALTPWLSVSREGFIYFWGDCGRWAIRLQKQFVRNTDYRNVYTAVTAQEARDRSTEKRARYRPHDMTELLTRLSAATVVEYGQFLHNSDPILHKIYQELGSMDTNLREGVDREAGVNALKGLERISLLWPNVYNALVQGNMSVRTLLRRRSSCREYSDWIEYIANRMIVLVGTYFFQIYDTTGNSIRIIVNGDYREGLKPRCRGAAITRATRNDPQHRAVAKMSVILDTLPGGINDKYLALRRMLARVNTPGPGKVEIEDDMAVCNPRTDEVLNKIAGPLVVYAQEEEEPYLVYDANGDAQYTAFPK